MTQASTGSNHHKFNNVQNNTGKINDVFKSILFLLLFLCILISLPSPVYSNYRSPFIIPINGEVITGFRQSYLDSDKQRFLKHTGIDIKGKYGQKVAAAGNGIVSYSGFSPTGGRTLVIKHNQKIRTTYLNLMQIYVSTGTYVRIVRIFFINYFIKIICYIDIQFSSLPLTTNRVYFNFIY